MASKVFSGRLAGPRSCLWNWHISIKPILEPSGLCFRCSFPSATLQSTCLLLPGAPNLSYSVLASHWWLQSCVKAAEKKNKIKPQDLAFPCWLDLQPHRAPGNVLLFPPVMSRSLLILSRQTPTHQAQAKARWFPRGLPGTSSS